MPKPPAAPVLYKTWQSSGVQATLDQFHTAEFRSAHEVSADQLIELAGAMLEKEKVTDALEVAKAAEGEAPKSMGVLMLVGRVERAAGHRVEALAAYSKALALSDSPRAFPELTAEIAALGNLAAEK